MVAQLIRQDDGSYDYVEVTAPKPLATTNLLSQVSTVAAKSLPAKSLPVTDEFEAYEGLKKGGEELVSAPSLVEQTEKIQRDIPSRVEFDPKTGTFITKKAKTIDLEYKEPERTAESTEETALQKVMNMQSMAGTGDAGLEKAYALMEKQQRATEALTKAQTFQSYAQTAKFGLDVYNIATGKDVLMKKLLTTPIKFKGSALTSMGQYINPYTMAAAALMTKPGRKIAKKVVKKIVKVGKSLGKKIADFFSDIRLKTNIEFLGKSPSNINIYKFNYKDVEGQYIGVMAHEVPWAAKRHSNGYLMVDYNKLDVEFRRIN
jgi:hypothetical protein